MASTWFYSNTKTQKWDKLEPTILTFGPLLISVILVAIVACIDKCSCCSCSCCCDYCLPMTEIIPNTFGAEIEEVTGVQENAKNIPMEDLEMSDHEDKEKQVKDEPENA